VQSHLITVACVLCHACGHRIECHVEYYKDVVSDAIVQLRIIGVDC